MAPRVVHRSRSTCRPLHPTCRRAAAGTDAVLVTAPTGFVTTQVAIGALQYLPTLAAMKPSDALGDPAGCLTGSYTGVSLEQLLLRQLRCATPNPSEPSTAACSSWCAHIKKPRDLLPPTTWKQTVALGGCHSTLDSHWPHALHPTRSNTVSGRGGCPLGKSLVAILCVWRGRAGRHSASLPGEW